MPTKIFLAKASLILGVSFALWAAGYASGQLAAEREFKDREDESPSLDTQALSAAAQELAHKDLPWSPGNSVLENAAAVIQESIETYLKYAS